MSTTRKTPLLQTLRNKGRFYRDIRYLVVIKVEAKFRELYLKVCANLALKKWKYCLSCT